MLCPSEVHPISKKCGVAMIDLIITLNICWTPMKMGRQDGSVRTMVSTNRTIWMTNIAMPDSISTNMMDQSFLPPLMPMTSRNTLKILNTIKPVTRVFTVMDMARLGRIIVDARCVLVNGSVKKYVEPLLASQVTRDNEL